MRNTFPEIILVPGGAASYDIGDSSAGITQMITALEELTEYRCGRGRTYRLIGEVNCSNEELENSPSPSGQKAYLRKYDFVIAGGTAVADNTTMDAFLDLKGEIMNVYLYDPYAGTDSLVEQGLQGLVSMLRDTTSLKVPMWNVSITLGYYGADTRKVLPHTYIA